MANNKESERTLVSNLSWDILPYLNEKTKAQILHYQTENFPFNVSNVSCEEDILEIQTRKLTVLSTISILTIMSNVAIMVAILTRNKKVNLLC